MNNIFIVNITLFNVICMKRTPTKIFINLIQSFLIKCQKPNTSLFFHPILQCITFYIVRLTSAY